MRHVLALSLITMCFSFAFAAGKSRKTNSIPPTSSTSRFVDKGRGFSIALPSGWQQDKDALGTVVMALSQKEGKSDNFRENINVVVEALSGKMSSKEYFDASQAAIKKVFHDQSFRLEKAGKEKLANNEFYWSVYTHKTPAGSLAKVLQYVTVKDLRAYIITCSAAPDRFNKYRPTFDTSLKSFRFE